jgi:putative transposase
MTRHLIHRLECQLTFGTLGATIDRDAVERLRVFFASVCEDFESELLDLRLEGRDRVSLKITYPPKHSVSGLLNVLKGVSSRLLQEARQDIAEKCVDGALWSPSYVAVSQAGETEMPQ